MLLTLPDEIIEQIVLAIKSDVEGSLLRRVAVGYYSRISHISLDPDPEFRLQHSLINRSITLSAEFESL